MVFYDMQVLTVGG